MRCQLNFFYKMILAAGLVLLAACTPDNVPLGPNESEPQADPERPVEIEAAREGVFTGPDGQQQALLVTEQSPLEIGQRVAVNEEGRAILHFGELLTVELLQNSAVQVQQFSPNAETIATDLWQDGGVLIADLTPQPETDQRLTVQTEYGLITATGGRFVVVREPVSSLEWVLALAAGEAELQISAGGLTQPLVGGQARWMTPAGEISPTVSVSKGVEAWLNGVRNNAEQPALNEILLPPANLLVDTGTITTLPAPGEPLELGRDVQGAINLTLDPKGIFGSPIYTLVDCNGDGVQDIAIQNGLLNFDFRPLLARVQAVDVSLFNRDRPGNGLLEGLDPAKTQVTQAQVEVGQGETQTLSLRSERLIYSARLTVSNACFLGVSLTPPGEAGEVAQVRPVKESPPQNNAVVNVLETSPERLAQNGQLQAPSVGASDDAGLIQIDGAQTDWDTLAQQSGVDWTAISAVTYDDGCANRYPDSGSLTDLAGRVQLAYDDQNLYLAFVVNDDGLATYSGADERYFLGDSVQLLLDLDLNGDFEASQLNADDVQVDLLPNADAPQAALWQLSTLTSSQLTDAVIAVTPTDTGYFIEAALPWPGLNVSPQPGDRLGIVASINDNDTPNANAQECIISTSPQRNWRNPTTWGTVLLMPAG